MKEKITKADGLLTVGQFSALVGARRSQLLYYDKRGIFSPAHREEAGQQASNRRYRIDQVFQYRTLCYFQRIGCTLEETKYYLNAPWAERSSFLLEREKQMELEMRKIQTMRESVVLTLRIQRLIEGTSPEHPSFFTLNCPVSGLYHPVDPPCSRATELFANAYMRHDEAAKRDPDILPAPALILYSVDVDKEGRFPVTGILSLFRNGYGQDRANWILPVGRYMIFEVNGKGGKLGAVLLRSRQYLIDHQFLRRGPVLACNIDVTQSDTEARYRECVLFPICEGYASPDRKPTVPGVE